MMEINNTGNINAEPAGWIEAVLDDLIGAPDEPVDASENATAFQEIEFTLIAKSDGPCSKRISLGNEGIVPDGSHCCISSGQAQRIHTDELPGETPLHAFAELINGMKPNEALCLGRLRDGIGDKVNVVTKKSLGVGPSPNTITRTREFIQFEKGKPAPTLIDFDQKDMPEEIKQCIKKAGDVWSVIAGALPGLANAGRISRASTSAGIRNTETGEEFTRSGGEHHYLIASDGSDIPRALKDLHDWMWYYGWGWYAIGKSGQLLERSPVDKTVGLPERLVFEGAPTVDPPLEQDLSAREPVVVDGDVINTRTAIPQLTPAQRDIVKAKKEAARKLREPEAARIRERADRTLAEQISERTGIHIATARRHVAARHEGKLMPAVPLMFDDDKIGTITVGHVLDNLERFIGETLADPMEGIGYGPCKAMVMRRDDGSFFIHSFAHGRAFYELVLDAARLRKEIEGASPQSGVDVLVANLPRTHLEVDELMQLRVLAASRAGVGVREVIARIKAARIAAAKKEAERAAAEQPADGRIPFTVPAEDAEMTPIMERIDSVLSKVEEPEPPMRTLGGVLCEIRERPIFGMHELASRDDAGSEEQIPAPPEPLISELDADGTTMAIERLIRHTHIKTGANVRLPTTFARAYRSYSNSALPRVIGVVVAPLVTEERVLARNGLDRELGLVFRIAPTLHKLIPKHVSDEEAEQAYRFLTDAWLCDVLTNNEGKALTVAAALTMVERTLLPERPAFFITAGQRGGGKTTLANMLTTAVLGRRASAAAWSENTEERRKAIFSYLRESPATLVWDNLPVGGSISCPTIEKALTSPSIQDRVLGGSEQMTVPATTVQFFTGNNILPRGDMISRSYTIRLEVDRPDPENREFRHQDPLGWTMNNRAPILRALYKLLIWNLRSRAEERPKTRFKRWWRLCGAPIEKITGVDFNEILRAHENNDAEVSGMVVLYSGLRKTYGENFFTANDVWQLSQAPGTGGPSDDWPISVMAALEEASGAPILKGPADNKGSKTIGRRLRMLSGRPVQVGGDVFRLDCTPNSTYGNRYRIKKI